MQLFFRNHFVRTLSILLALAMAGMLGGNPVLAQSSIDLVIHYVEGTPSKDALAYDVTAYVSVADSTGNPIKDLKPADFTVVEDSQKVEVLSAEPATDSPINLVLLLDTSGSMNGPAITAAKNAASNFIAGLNPEDRVALVTFDDTVKTIIDFTTDTRAARDELSLVDAVRGAGTCLYDAAYQAVQMTAMVPSGRRAVVLFTDGVDEKSSGGQCSLHNADDVIKLATEAGTRTPIYTLGMGNKVDQNALKKLSQDTGGRFFYSPDPDQLDAIFIRLSDALRSQYAIKYSSTAGPGTHLLAITSKYLNAQDTDTRTFLLPNFPLSLTFVEPKEGQEVSGLTTLKVTSFGGGETIESVIFQINGTTVATDTSTPYEVQVDLKTYAAGNLTINVIAQGTGGIELARASRTVKVLGGTATPTLTPTPAPGIPKNLKDWKFKDFLPFIIIGGILLVGAVIASIIITVLLRRRREHLRDLEWQQKVGGIGESPAVETLSATQDRTLDSFEMSPDALGRLTVTASDDGAMIGQHFEIMNPRTTLGRKADNDIIFPKDSPVSRHHAVIEEKGGGMFLSEVEETDEKTGQTKRPTYGTFVDEKKLSIQPVLLETGNEIRLGNRLRLKYDAGQRIRRGNEKTLDDFTSSGPDDMQDKTQEA
jgi:VWFA-related protein